MVLSEFFFYSADTNYGFASAMSWIYFLIVIVIIGVSSFIISKGVYYYD